MSTPRWWIVYGDRRIYSSEDGPAHDALGVDVQVVVLSSPEHGWEVLPRKASDYFVYLPEPDAWRGVDLFGLWDYLFNTRGPKVALAGRTMLDVEWRALLEWVQQHPDLPTKTGWLPGERD